MPPDPSLDPLHVGVSHLPLPRGFRYSRPHQTLCYSLSTCSTQKCISLCCSA
jgi:hypothetical protein